MNTEEVVKKINSYNSLKKFMKDINITIDIIAKNQDFLEDFLLDYQECESGFLKDCLQKNQGYQPFLKFSHKMFYGATKHCAHWLMDNKNYQIKKNFIYCDYNIDDNSETIFSYFEKIKNDNSVDESRKKFIKWIQGIVDKKTDKGVFLTGPPGVGKTFLLQLSANQFAFLNHQVAFVAVSNLIKTIKDSFSNEELKKDNLLRKLMHVEYLFLDDIGGEVVTQYSRDEILFTLLNYRMENKKITFFSSNFDMKSLNQLYGEVTTNLTNRDINIIKTSRFTDRIKALAKELKINGENKRY
ncbi:primosomal protein DnaI [Spiroplasma sabaudiense Ar-1343]|uniref:Primosomal protein DnaI n=1 Tax=Spiroplasma sabaudiense Ar-1343 TaxID=1276257 RepID=W6AB48_9MOLU|nr:ATP-binding protein [Spiroplasma sabaudiense]AHI54085.1 primosomal protein DnaI [Spiroplasma sabaudiense Ar-1343]